jgi:hypothetical protein
LLKDDPSSLLTDAMEVVMEARAERLKRHRPQLHLLPREAVEEHPIALLGTFCGLAGGLVRALPLVIYDWAKASHAALELPMAVSAWLFGLNHFDQDGYVVWAIIVGAVIARLLGAQRTRVRGARRSRLRRAEPLREPRTRHRLELRQLHVLLVHAAPDRS